jgi:hypothetical protein
MYEHVARHQRRRWHQEYRECACRAHQAPPHVKLAGVSWEPLQRFLCGVESHIFEATCYRSPGIDRRVWTLLKLPAVTWSRGP